MVVLGGGWKFSTLLVELDALLYGLVTVVELSLPVLLLFHLLLKVDEGELVPLRFCCWLFQGLVAFFTA